jgi:hypothetical protein
MDVIDDHINQGIGPTVRNHPQDENVLSTEQPVNNAVFRSEDFQYEQTDVESGNGLFGGLEQSAEGQYVVTSQVDIYEHRGDNLAFLSLTEFACCIRLMKEPFPEPQLAPPDEHSETRAGRRPNVVSKLRDTYAFHATQHLRVTSKISVPIFGGMSAIPAYPAFNIDNPDEVSLAFHHQRNAWAECMLAILIPWPAPGHYYADGRLNAFERLSVILPLLECGRFLLQTDNYFQGNVAVHLHLYIYCIYLITCTIAIAVYPGIRYTVYLLIFVVLIHSYTLTHLHTYTLI